MLVEPEASNVLWIRFHWHATTTSQ